MLGEETIDGQLFEVEWCNQSVWYLFVNFEGFYQIFLSERELFYILLKSLLYLDLLLDLCIIFDFLETLFQILCCEVGKEKLISLFLQLFQLIRILFDE